MTGELATVRADSIVMRSIEYVDKPELQRAAFHLAAGVKGCGKGTWTAHKASALTRGLYGPPRNVLIVSSEDSAQVDTVPRLTAAGADLERVHLVVGPFLLPDDLERLRTRAEAIGNVGMIVIDPIGNHLGGADTDKEGAVRNAISGLNKLADELDCIVLGIRHLGKARQGGALAAVLGSVAWVDLPRAVLAFAKDDEDEMLFHVQVVAGNRSGRCKAQSYRIELRDVPGLGEPVTYASAVGETTKDVDDLLQAPRRTSKSAEARDLILDILENEGEQGSDALDARIAEATGITAGTAKNQRQTLKNEGLIRNVPIRDEQGAIKTWNVARTAAPRPHNGSAKP